MLIKLEGMQANKDGEIFATFEQVFDHHEVEECFEKCMDMEESGWVMTWRNLGEMDKHQFLDAYAKSLNEAIAGLYK